MIFVFTDSEGRGLSNKEIVFERYTGASPSGEAVEGADVSGPRTLEKRLAIQLEREDFSKIELVSYGAIG